MNKISVGIIVLLLGIIAFGAWKFMVQGSALDHPDGRLSIKLTESERNLVLGEMRGFLVSVQQIVQGLAEEDIGKVVESARKSGRAAQGAVPGSLVGKLPMDFKKLGFDTHSRFDQLALDAEALEDPAVVHEQLARLMENCVGCHAAYRLDAVTP